jgi:DNA-binding transcriptional ArsR family regulator
MSVRAKANGLPAGEVQTSNHASITSTVAVEAAVKATRRSRRSASQPVTARPIAMAASRPAHASGQPASAERTALYQTLTNPVRRRILAHIGQHGEANSTSVARAIGESTGTTSYHLRKLAEQHLIEEIPDRSTGRERWWRALPLDHRPAAPAMRTAEEQSALRSLRAQQLSADIELALTADAEFEGPDGWVQGSRWGGYMTREELLAFYDEYLALLAKYGHSREDAPEGARPMAFRFFGLPQPE